MLTEPLNLPESYNLSEITDVQKRDIYAHIYLGGGQYAVVLTSTGQTVGRLSEHPSGAYTATAMDGQHLLIDGGRHYYGDHGPQHLVNLVVWPNP